MYAFAAPGWSHDGSSFTIKQIQKEIKLSRISKLKKAA